MEQFNYTTNKSNNQSFRKNHFNHLTYTDRINIEQLLLLKNNPDYVGEKITLNYIAKIIGVNKSTISREIKKYTFKELNQPNGKLVSYYLATLTKKI